MVKLKEESEDELNETDHLVLVHVFSGLKAPSTVTSAGAVLLGLLLNLFY